MTSKPPTRKTDAPFWETKSLAEMTAPEWESLCDGCGRLPVSSSWKMKTPSAWSIPILPATCSMARAAVAAITPTVSGKSPDCLQLTPESVSRLGWLPPSCAYRRLSEGRPLPAWHPLITGDADSVHRAGASVRGRVEPLPDGFSLVALAENDMDALMERITDWPEADVPDEAGTREED